MGSWEKRNSAAVRRRDLRKRAVDYLGGQCCICGYDRCASAFDFHHVNPRDKDFTISSRMTSWSRIKPELDKCTLLCSNCHREVHDGLHPFYLQDEAHLRGRDDRQMGLFESDAPLDPDPPLAEAGEFNFQQTGQSLHFDGRGVAVDVNAQVQSDAVRSVHAADRAWAASVGPSSER